MRKYVLILCACVMMCCLVCMYPVSTLASENASAEISAVIYRYMNRSDGAPAEARTYDLCECFFKDPVAFVRQLSHETEDVKNVILEALPQSMYYPMHPKGFQEFPDTVYSIQLTDEDTEETRNVVKALENGITKYWGITKETIGNASAEISAVIYRYMNRSDGAPAEARTYDLCECFFKDPVAFVRQLSREAEDVQNTVVNHLPRSMRAEMHPKGFQEFPDTVYSIQLTDEDTAETRNIVKALEAGITKYWGIINPNTGDSIGVAALLMAFSGLGTALLWKKRRLVAE